MKGLNDMQKITINKAYCKGCSLCVEVCPKKVLRLSDKLGEKGYHPAECFNDEGCIACAMCANMCPDVAITVEKP